MDFNKMAKKGALLIAAPLILTACMSGDGAQVSTEGQTFFNDIANKKIAYAFSENIKNDAKNEKAAGHCTRVRSVENGIDIVRSGFCDKNGEFSIMVTNRASYPPSKRPKFLSLHFGDADIKLYPDKTQEITGVNGNAISIELDKTASSFIIKGKGLYQLTK